MFVPLSYNVRSLFVRKSATLLTVLGIGATVAIVSGILALQQGFETMFTAGGRDDLAVFLRPGSTNEGDSQFSRDRGLKLMKSVQEIEVGPKGPLASMEAYLALLLEPTRGGLTNVPLRGVQPMTFDIRQGELEIVDGRNFTPGTDELIVGSRLVDRIKNCRKDDVLQLNNTPFRVVGVFEHEGQFGGEIWGDLDRVLAAMGRYGPNRVIATLKPGTKLGAPDPNAQFKIGVPEDKIAAILAKYSDEDAARATLNRLIGVDSWVALIDRPQAEIAAQLELGGKSAEASKKIYEFVQKAAKDLEPLPGSLAERLLKENEVPAKVLTEKQFVESQTVMLTFILLGLGAALGLIMGLAAIFTATNTMLAAITARTHEIGILLATGFRPLSIFLSFLFEALVLGLAGGVVGCLMALPFNGVRAGTMNFQTFTEMQFAFRVSGAVLFTAVVFSIGLGLVGGALPAWRAARMKPTTALRRT